MKTRQTKREAGMTLNSIQSKIGGALILILLIILGISFTIISLQSRNLLHQQQEESEKAIHDGTLDRAHSVFSSLDIGTKGSLERGEMDVFDELVTGLGEVPGVIEIGLTDPQGKIIYTSNKNSMGQSQSKINIGGKREEIEFEKEYKDSFFIAHSKMFREDCLMCHDAEAGTLSGVLYLDFSLQELNQEKAYQQEVLAAATSKSIWSSLGMGALSIVITFLVIFFLLRRMIVVPLAKIKSVLTDIAKGHLTERLNLPQKDEIGDTARTLDSLANDLEAQVVQPLQQLAQGDLSFEVTPYDQDDSLRHALIIKKIAPRGHIRRLRLRPDAKRVGPRMNGRVAFGIDCQHLPVFNKAPAFRDLFNSLGSRQPLFHQVEREWTERRVGHVLRGHSPDTGPRIGTARRHRRRGGGNRDPEHPGVGTARHK